jgi:hypothetical protein
MATRFCRGRFSIQIDPLPQIHNGYRVRILVRIMPLSYDNVIELSPKIEGYGFSRMPQARRVIARVSAIISITQGRLSKEDVHAGS